ncbi:MAG: diguanylate cyclase [Deltaproteobacteria bacterium]|nr:diguanylate cyclase [Deltaproteobacteria bacterium]
MNDSLISRLSSTSFQDVYSLTPFQQQVDSLVSRFNHEMTQASTFASMTAGALVYRGLSCGLLSLTRNGSGILSAFVPTASRGIALLGEASTFETAQRVLHRETLSTGRFWHGFGQNVLGHFFNFGILKGAGNLTASSNIILQHGASNLAMVAGQQVTGALQLTPLPQTSFLEQWLEAESINLALGFGNSLVRQLSPQLHAFERSLSLAVSPVQPSQFSSHGPEFSEFAFASAGSRPTQRPRSSLPAIQIVHMSNEGDGIGKTSSIPPSGPEVPLGRRPRTTPPSQRNTTISDILLEMLREIPSERGRAFLTGLHARVEVEHQAAVSNALAKLRNGETLDVLFQGLLAHPELRAAISQSTEIQALITSHLAKSVDPSAQQEGDFFQEGVPTPSHAVFRHLVSELDLPATTVAKVLNRVFHPLIDLDAYPYKTEIYIGSEEDVERLRLYATSDKGSLGEFLFFQRRGLDRNWSMKDASRHIGITDARLHQLEQNLNPPTSDELEQISKTYSAGLEFLQRTNKRTRYANISQHFYTAENSPAPPPIRTKAEPGLDPAQQHALRVERLRFLQQKRGGTTPLTVAEAEEVFELAQYFFNDSREYRALATLDPMTSLLNKRGLNEMKERLERRLMQSRTSGDPSQVSDWVIMLDGDHFKSVNDTYGHQNGDRVIKALGQAIKASIRENEDVAARFGGEEFCIWLANSKREGAIVVMERIQKHLMEHPILLDGYPPIHVTVSMGAAEMSVTLTEQGIWSADNAFDHAERDADHAMYQAKQEGRNRFVITR